MTVVKLNESVIRRVDSDRAPGRGWAWYAGRSVSGYTPTVQATIEGLPINPTDVEKLGVPLGDEFGIAGINRFGSQVQDEWHRELQGRRGMAIYREMTDNEPILWTLLRIYKMMAIQVKWRAKPPSDVPKAIEISNWLTRQMQSMPMMTWAQFVEDALSCMEYGFAFLEEVYRIDEETGRVTWKKISSRSQETLDGWAYDEQSKDWVGMYQRADAGHAALIPRAKALHLVMGYGRENPEGRSLLRGAFIPYKMAKELRRFEGITFERAGPGMPLAMVPPELLASSEVDDRATITKIKKLLWQIRTDERMGVLFPGKFYQDGTPSGYELTTLQMQGAQASSALGQAIIRLESRMAMTLHGEGIFLGLQGAAGSHAQAEVKTGTQLLALGAILDILQDALNSQSVPRLMKYNAIPRELWPHIEHEDIEKPDLTALMTFVQGLFTIGVDVSDEETGNFLKSLANLPTKLQKTA